MKSSLEEIGIRFAWGGLEEFEDMLGPPKPYVTVPPSEYQRARWAYRAADEKWRRAYVKQRAERRRKRELGIGWQTWTPQKQAREFEKWRSE